MSELILKTEFHACQLLCVLRKVFYLHNMVSYPAVTLISLAKVMHCSRSELMLRAKHTVFLCTLNFVSKTIDFKLHKLLSGFYN